MRKASFFFFNHLAKVSYRCSKCDSEVDYFGACECGFLLDAYPERRVQPPLRPQNVHTEHWREQEYSEPWPPTGREVPELRHERVFELAGAGYDGLRTGEVRRVPETHTPASPRQPSRHYQPYRPAATQADLQSSVSPRTYTPSTARQVHAGRHASPSYTPGPASPQLTPARTPRRPPVASRSLLATCPPSLRVGPPSMYEPGPAPEHSPAVAGRDIAHIPVIEITAPTPPGTHPQQDPSFLWAPSATSPYRTVELRDGAPSRNDHGQGEVRRGSSREAWRVEAPSYAESRNENVELNVEERRAVACDVPSPDYTGAGWAGLELPE